MAALLSLPVFCCYSGGYDGLVGILGIKPGVYNLGGYSPGACGFGV